MKAHAHPCDEAQAHARYRVYWLGVRGLIDGAEAIWSTDDREAIATARGMTDDRSVELWDRKRFVGRFDPEISAASEQP
jgi:hypothetical protein